MNPGKKEGFSISVYPDVDEIYRKIDALLRQPIHPVRKDEMGTYLKRFSEKYAASKPVIDRAMQIFGAMGLTPDTPLSHLWSWGRALRFIDGPDEVHIRAVARREIKEAKEARGRTLAYMTPPEAIG